MSDWDARTYDRVCDPLLQWGERVLARLPLRGDEVVLDAGCGSGRVTRLLLERLPRGRVYGVDRSPAMLEVAHEQLADFGDRLRLVQGDLTTVRLPEPVHAVFSNATFHWVLEHSSLFRNLHSVLVPGGLLVAQCGGAGNIVQLNRCADAILARPPYAQVAKPAVRAFHFAGAVETLDLLRAAGFLEARAWLQLEPTDFPDRASYVQYLTTVVLRPQQALVPEEMGLAYVQAVVDETERSGLGHQVDYVRLNISGRRAT